MKIKDGFILREIAGQPVVIPSDTRLDTSLMITLNETGTFIWQQLQQETNETAIIEAILSEYEVDAETARNCVEVFVAKLRDNGLLS